ncbi:MAG TPA: Mrp/NBP35 family ATP-binding protein [Acidimicrobiales bacterium]|nr:Mrp/NBP35 family ATP-binding protein [Acidimicrobiales bacterium]
MARDQAGVEQAVAAVVEPELGLPLGDIGAVRGVHSRRHRAEIALVLPVAAWPNQDRIRDLVRAAAAGVDGIDDVAVQIGVMDDDDRAALRRRLRDDMDGPDGDAGPGAGGSDGHGGGHGGGGGDHGHGGGGGGGGHGGHGHGHGDATPTPRFLRPESPTRLIGISSGKGGVGKSSVTVNLAVALARLGKRVGVLDADVYGFSVPKMLGADHDPIVLGDLVIPAAAYGVRVLSMGFFVPDDQPVIWRGPMLHKAIEQFLGDAWWGQPDLLLVDMPPGTGDVTLSLAQVMPRSEILVVTTPQPAAQRVAQRSAYAARKLRLSVRGVIENMSWFTGDDGTRYDLFGSGGGQALADDLGIPLLGQLPLVPALRQGGDEGRPVAAADPDGEVGRAFSALAQRIAGMGPARVYRRELAVRQSGAG